MTKDYEIRTMTADEFANVVDWAAREGWNPGLHDATCYRATDPEGFLVGVLDGEPVASISVVRYDDSFGFLGFYIVRPEFRGRGLGLAIWNAGLAHLEGCCVGLDGVVAQQDNYRASGFELAWRNVRFMGRGHDGGGEDRTVDLASLPFETLEAYDRDFFPAPRAAFTRAWIDQPAARARGLMEHGRLSGYGVIRRCREGFKIGPLFADTPEHAEILFTDLAGFAGRGESVYLDVPEPHAEAVALAARHAMTVSFETARMYRGAAPELPLRRTYGVTSFEIG